MDIFVDCLSLKVKALFSSETATTSNKIKQLHIPDGFLTAQNISFVKPQHV